MMSQASPIPQGLSSSQTILMALLIGFSLGSVGLLALALMVLLSHQRFGVDRSAKHGISVDETSRLGGLAILLFLMIIWSFSLLRRENFIDIDLVVPLIITPFYIWPVLLIGMIGLFEDLGLSIKPAVRLSVMIAIGVIFFLLKPELLPNRLLEVTKIEGFWAVLGLSAASGVFFAGFVNAANISDGANGLLSGVCLVFFWVAWQLQGDGWSFYLLIILLCFWLINVLTGRILLGDLGAYALGALIVFVAFDLFDERNVSPFFLASLLCYPCLEILRAMIVRWLRGQSLLSADNAHLHNLLNAKLSASLRSNTLPNSLTGMLIMLITTIPGIMTFSLGLQGDNVINLTAFGLQAIIFLKLWVWLEKA